MMNRLQFSFLIISAILHASLAEDEPLYTNGSLVITQTSSIRSRMDFSFDCTDKYGTFCDNDCSTLLTCLGDSAPHQSILCSKKSQSTPFCQSQDTKCTPLNTGLENGCNYVKTDFYCTGVGFFPDIKNCSQYYFCHEKAANYELYACPPNYVYDQKSLNCKRTEHINCVEINCSENIDEFVVYETDPSVYVYCTTNGIGEVMYRILKCQKPGEVFNEIEQKCQFECVADGRFPDPEAVNYFYECGTYCNFRKRLLSCPPDLYYDPIYNGCTLEPPHP